MRIRMFWYLLLAFSGLALLLYLFYTLLPGSVDPQVWNYFSKQQVQAGRDYQRAGQLIFVLSFLCEALFLSWLIFSGRAERLGDWAVELVSGNRLLGVLIFFLVLWFLLRLLNLPFTLYSSYYLQHQWGFSTQNLAGWWSDYFKGALLDLILSAVGVLLLFWATGRWPGGWWLAAGAFLAAWTIIQSFLWPVAISPLFNKFEPVRDGQVLAMVDKLSARAGVPVGQVLEMDASSRTTKANAYFTGLGKTKRIVLYDNLLKDYPPEEVGAVIAHEMAHWRQGHIVKGIVYGILGIFVLLFALFLVLHSSLKLPSGGPYPPQAWAVMLLFFLLLSLLSSPIQNSLSRSMESEADAVAVQLTGDPQGAVRLHRDLAEKNLSDISPAPYIEWFSYTHPSTIHRIEQFSKYSAAQ